MSYSIMELKAAIVHACDDQDDALFYSLGDCEIVRDTDAGHAQLAAYVTSENVSPETCCRPLSVNSGPVSVLLPTSAKPPNSIMNYCLSVQRAPTFVASQQGMGVDYTDPMKASTFNESSSSSVPWAIDSVTVPWTRLRKHFEYCFDRHGSIDDLDTNIQLRREATSLIPRDLQGNGKTRSRQSMKKRVPPSFVASGQDQPGAGKGKALLAVDSELELVHKLVPATANRITISGDAATRASDEKTPDEVIHLAAGLQFSGFKSVVGTLWEVDHAVAKHVVEAFYKYMFGDLKNGSVMDCTRATRALNCATHAVKTKVPLEQRMIFVHIGV
ncbi:hypothetical protein C8R48DRAFT_674049 [Suillus tomentosus]|nr:hypothetical protein C8R48DRAFT_674049 [Suillus tomentosus]